VGFTRYQQRDFLMARGPLSFKATDLTRAVRAVLAAGLSVAKVEVDKGGRIVVVAVEPDKTAPDQSGVMNEWDIP
jgi:hypothetical protein